MPYLGKDKTDFGKYNISAFCKDQKMTVVEFAELAKVWHSTIYHYLAGKRISLEAIDRIESIVENNTDFPEEYLLERNPYVPTKGRKQGSKNKNSPVKLISVEDYNNEKALPKTVSRKQIKSYLSYDELFSALANGDTVYQDNSTYSYQLLTENNCSIVLKLRDNKPVFLNCAIDLSGSYYTLKKEKLILDVGKKYRNKGGEEVLIFAKTEDNTFRGIITGDNAIYLYDVNGQYGGESRLNDLDEEVA